MELTISRLIINQDSRFLGVAFHGSFSQSCDRREWVGTKRR